MSEQRLQRAILDYLNTQGHFRIINVVPFQVNGRLAKSTMKGMSDIVGVLKGGRFMACEVKAPDKKAKPTPGAQTEYLERVRACGGLSICVNNLEDVQAQIAQHITGADDA